MCSIHFTILTMRRVPRSSDFGMMVCEFTVISWLHHMWGLDFTLKQAISEPSQLAFANSPCAGSAMNEEGKPHKTDRSS